MTPITLFTIGIILIIFEIFLYSFFIIWVGISFVIISIVEYFYPLSSLYIQLTAVAILSLALFLLFGTRLKKMLNKTENPVKADFIKQQGNGVIKNNMLYYQGSYFNVLNLDISSLEGVKVKVVKIENSNAYIELDS